MKESDIRIQYIADYISSYEAKIRLLNSKGLFDTATLFESFALKTCEILFNKDFLNLNINTFTYPHVDLISLDRELYVQVSTVKDIPKKIKKTLEDIRDSKKDEIRNIKRIKFFMLNNDSISKVKNYKDKNQIGDITFNKSEDLITTKTILDHATHHLDFQIKLYELIKQDVESIKNNSLKLNEAIERCKTVELKYINCLINNEYEIDRKNLIDKISRDNSQFLAILGGAGSGKSVICRKIAEASKKVIFARAEKFLECNSINDIWGFNVRETFEMLGDSQLVIFIDALEFIADNYQKTIFLHELYEISKERENIKIIVSCRTTDFNSFIKISKSFRVKIFEISNLTEIDVDTISSKYPIISKMESMSTYGELLKNPLYIDIIVSNLKDTDSIRDENQLREYIWYNVVCLKNKSVKYGFKHNEVIKTIELIVFDRAVNFLLGSHVDQYDSVIIDALLSEDVLILNGKTVRLKYDIFEDICFEQYFDKIFDESKGDYNFFFERISKIGRCVFRRFQIWISNKLLAKENRKKFINEIVFSKQIPELWKKQTKIGLVKSRYSNLFFEEYTDQLISSGIIQDFIKTTNLYGFEIDNDSFKKYFNMLELKPVGQGRQSLISIVFNNKLHKIDHALKQSIQKLCTDYSRVKNKDKQLESQACSILGYYVDVYINENNKKPIYGLDKTINRLLKPLYQMAESSKEWILNLWKRLTTLLMGEEDKSRLSAKIIEDTIGANHVMLTKELPNELCELAELYWTHEKKTTKPNHHNYERDRFSNHHFWGLNEYAEAYDRKKSNLDPLFSSFFFALFRTNYWLGLEWTINFLNKLSQIFAKNSNIKSPNYDFYFVDEKKKRTYYGDFSMWTFGTNENTLPMIINDLVYCLREQIKYSIKNEFNTKKDPNQFAEETRKMIFNKSNNIILLSVISDIGKEFFEDIPGYSLDLISNFDIIYHDLSKTTLTFENTAIKLLKKQMLLITGIPNLPERYKVSNSIKIDIRNYVLNCQFSSDEIIKKKCFTTLDYLYSITKNDKKNARDYLQIQNMDIRKAKIKKTGKNFIEIIPEITGEAKIIVDENDTVMLNQKIIGDAIYALNIKISNQDFVVNDVVQVIETILENGRDDAYHSLYEKTTIDLISFALNSPDLVAEHRNKYCTIWIEGIESYFNNESFIFNHKLVKILFEQIEKEIDESIKRRLEKLILDCVLNGKNHGVIFEISTYAKQYLKTNNILSKSVFNVIVKLSEDMMNHQKYNWKYLKPKDDKGEIEFKPNFHPKLINVDYQIEINNDKLFSSQRDKIINKYLFEKKELNLRKFNISNHDITLMSYAFNFGATLSNSKINIIVKTMLSTMIDIWDTSEHSNISYEILDVYSQAEFSEFLQYEFVKDIASANRVLDIIFKNICFDKFTNNTYEFYDNILGKLLVSFFNSYNNESKRKIIKKIIDRLENEILKIENHNVQNRLLKNVILSPNRYNAGSDWSKYPSGYSYQDRLYLNEKFSSYGYLHLEEMLLVINKLNYEKLLPEIIISLNNTFIKAIDFNNQNKDFFSHFVIENKQVILPILYKAFIEFGDEIKQDYDLTMAFENILNMIIEYNHEEFAIILDEFRLH